MPLSDRCNRPLWAVSLACIVFLTGCQTRTLEMKKSVEWQPRAADTLAWDHGAARLAQALQDGGYFAPSATPGLRPVFYVYSRSPGSTFLFEVGKALESEIIQRGGAVARSPAGSTIVNLEVDLIHWTGESGIGTVAEASWGATVDGQGFQAMRFRDRFYLRAGDADLYASSMTLAPMRRDAANDSGSLRPIRLVR